MSLEELCRKYYGEKAPYSDDTNLQGSHGQCKEEHKREADIPPSTSTTTRNLRGKVLSAIATASETSTQYFKVEDLDEDDSDDYIPPPEIWKKEVRLGPEYQVYFRHTSEIVFPKNLFSKFKDFLKKYI